MIQEFKFKKDRYYKAILKLVNVFIGLTDYELSIISTMLIHNIKTLDTASRVIVREKLNANVATFNNYIKRLKDKKCLIETKDGLIISDRILNSIEDGRVDITFNIIE